MLHFHLLLKVAVISLVLGSSFLATAEDASSTSGFRVHQVDSPYQSKPTTLRVLLPDQFDAGKRYRVLLVLPVHEDGVFHHGDGLVEVKKLDVHNMSQVICVAPSFTAKPWYADHDLDPEKRDESHLMKTVLPYLEKHYPVRRDGKGRLLLGFSKSGWGAFTLLLRHPDRFHRAVGWDPGVRIDTGPFDEGFDREGRLRKQFGSATNFERFRLSTLLMKHGKNLGEETRLFYFNREGGSRTEGGIQIRELMIGEGIPHRYVLDRYREHRWDSGWLEAALAFLVRE